MKKTLAMIMQQTKTETNMAINHIIKKNGIPAYLMEGIITGVLSDIREMKNNELMEEIKAIKRESDTKTMEGNKKRKKILPDKKNNNTD